MKTYKSKLLIICLSTLFYALAGASIWGYIATLTGQRSFILAVLIGIGIGASIQFSAKSKLRIYSIVGFIGSVFSCLLGYYMSTLFYLFGQQGVSNMFADINSFESISISYNGFGILDILFVISSGCAGYAFSRGKSYS